MNPYIGDRQLDPPDEDEEPDKVWLCPECGGPDCWTLKCLYSDFDPEVEID